MLSIRPDAAFKRMNRIYGSKDIVRRYEWFLFEYGKRASRLFYKHLLQQISEIPGTKNYKKALMLAEIRDRGRRAWWAIVASAKPMGAAQYSPKTSIFQVSSRFTVDEDPVREILDEMGPWTVETIPFVPSPRAGQVVLKTVSEEQVKAVKEMNLRNGEKTNQAMIRHGISYTPRHVVYQKLRVIEDIEMNALRIEFGLAEKSKAHWRPSIRWIKRVGYRQLERDQDLIRVWMDATFAKYRLLRHFGVKLTPEELKRIQSFQDKFKG
jgi:hypothetical protein